MLKAEMNDKAILVMAKKDLKIWDGDRLIELKKGAELEIPFRFYKRFVEFEYIHDFGKFRDSIRMDS